MLEIIAKRRSCRKFDRNHPVEKEKIAEIVKAGLHAPSGQGHQDGIVVVISKPEIRDRLAVINAKICGWPEDFDPFYGAPVVLLVACKKNPYPDLDGAAMIQNMLLEATAQGLATCWIHRAKPEWEMPEVRELLSSSGLNFDDYVGVDHIALGYGLSGEPASKTIKDGRVFYID